MQRRAKLVKHHGLAAQDSQGSSLKATCSSSVLDERLRWDMIKQWRNSPQQLDELVANFATEWNRLQLRSLIKAKAFIVWDVPASCGDARVEPPDGSS